MELAFAIIGVVALLTSTLLVAVAYFASKPSGPPSPRPKRDENVAVLEGGSGRRA